MTPLFRMTGPAGAGAPTGIEWMDMWIRYGLGQGARAASTVAAMVPLEVVNRSSTELIDAGGDGVVVSLTTHGSRLKSAHLAIESIARGTVSAPIVLWLDQADYETAWPAAIRRLVERGLIVRCSDGEYGPHTKYWGTFRRLAGTGRRVVTIDDDIIYPPWFLERLLLAGGTEPETVTAYRVHRITMRGREMLPYRRWRPATSTAASALHFATGVSGVLYPAGLIDYVVAQGDRFRRLSPLADDVWLHRCELRSGHPVRQVYSLPQNFAVMPAGQLSALALRNTFNGGNDRQIADVYDDGDIDTLWRAALSRAETGG